MFGGKQCNRKGQLADLRHGREVSRFINGTYAVHGQWANISGWKETVGPYTFSITASTATTFTAQASGNIDSDPTLDVWTVNQDGTLTNTTNDV